LLVALPVAFVLRTTITGWETVMSVRALADRDVAYVDDAGVFLVSTDGGPLALSEVSPHLQHPLLFCRSAGGFQGKHGEVFDRHGFYISGPSVRGMDRVAVRVNDDLIEIDAEAVRPGPRRGAGPPEELSGELCRVPGLVDEPGFAADP
jgi:hypothetical protein